MNFRLAYRERNVGVNITPLVDVVFLMLIFLLVSTTFKQESEIEVRLPEVGEEPPPLQVEGIRVTIDAQDRVFIDDIRVSADRDDLSVRLREIAAGRDEEPTVTIRADAEARHQAVIRVMDAARMARLRRVAFTTRSLEEEENGQ